MSTMARLRIFNALVFALIYPTLPHHLSECLSSFGSSLPAEDDSTFFTTSSDNATEEITRESYCFISMTDVLLNVRHASLTTFCGLRKWSGYGCVATRVRCSSLSRLFVVCLLFSSGLELNPSPALTDTVQVRLRYVN